MYFLVTCFPGANRNALFSNECEHRYDIPTTFLFNVYIHLIKQIEIGLCLLHIIAVIIRFKCRSERKKIDFSVLLGDIIDYWYAG